MNHYQRQAARREIQINDTVLSRALLLECAAVIINRSRPERQPDGGYYGLVTILIVREHAAVTVMHRRSTQTINANVLNVAQLVDYSQ